MSRDAPLGARFTGAADGPGDDGEGGHVPREPIGRVRALSAHRRYTDRSPSFAGAAVQGAAVQLHEGPVELGDEIPFALRLPDDAYPNWQEPATETFGTLSWSLVIEADI